MDYSFGSWVKRRRKALDLTQQDLAEKVGCSLLIFKIESDGRRPSRQMAELLAEHLDIPFDQRDLFMQVARQEKNVDRLEPIQPVSEFISVPVVQQFFNQAATSPYPYRRTRARTAPDRSADSKS